MRVNVRGQVFESVRECAKHFGISEDTVYCAVTRRTTDTIGTGRKRPKAPGTTPFARKDPFKIGRWSWPSMVQCSKDLGISYDKFKKAFSCKVLSRETVLRRRMELEQQIAKVMLKRESSEGED